MYNALYRDDCIVGICDSMYLNDKRFEHISTFDKEVTHFSYKPISEKEYIALLPLVVDDLYFIDNDLYVNEDYFDAYVNELEKVGVARE